MFMKKKQLLREIPNKDSCPGSQESEVEMTALGINLNQPLTDQLTKHHKSLKTHSWDAVTYSARNATAPAADDVDISVVATTEIIKPDHLDKNSSILRASSSPVPTSKWSEGLRNELGEKSCQTRNDVVPKVVEFCSDSSLNSGYVKNRNGISFSLSNNGTKLHRKFLDSYCANVKEFEDKLNSPSNEKLKQVEKVEDPIVSTSSSLSSLSSSSSSLSSSLSSSSSSSLLILSSSSLVSLGKGLSGRGQAICSTLLTGSLPEHTTTVPTLSRYPLCSLPVQLLPTLPNSATLNHHELPQLMMRQQQQQHAAAQLQQLHLLQQQRHQQQQPPQANSNSVLSSYSLHADNMLMHQLEMLWQQKYPNHAVPPDWMLFQYQDELLHDPCIPLLKESSVTRDKDEAMYERERMLQTMVEKEKLDWERQEREHSERERMEMERYQTEKKERAHWEQEKHVAENQEQNQTLERKRHEWERHQQEARHDQQQRLQLEMYQRRELIVDESASSASDAVNQHFHESFLRLASQKGEGPKMEVANPSYAYMTGPRNIYRDRVKIERHQNPLCSKIEEKSKYLKSSHSCNSKLQDVPGHTRESGQHPILRQDISQPENNRHGAQLENKSHSSNMPSHFTPELLNFNIYGYQPATKEHLFNSSSRTFAHEYTDDACPKVESDVPKYDRPDSFGSSKNGSTEPKHDFKQSSVIMEPRGTIRDLQSDIYHHGSIILGTSGTSLHRARPEALPVIGISIQQSGLMCSTAGNHNTVLYSGSKSAIGNPSSISAAKDQKHGLNLTSSSRPMPAVSTGMFTVETVDRDRINPWLASTKEQYEPWRETLSTVQQKNTAANLSHQKLTNYPIQNIPPVSQLTSSGHHLATLATCSLIEQGLVPNPMYISSTIPTAGANSTLAPNISALHRSNHSHIVIPALSAEDIAKSLEDIHVSVKRRPKKENGSGMKKKSRLDSDGSRFPVSKSSSAIMVSFSDSTRNSSTALYANSQPAYLDSFKSFVDHAVQNAFLQDKDVEADQSSSVREKMRHLIESEPRIGDDGLHELGVSAVFAAPAVSPEPEKSLVSETVDESDERSSACTPASVNVVTMSAMSSVPLTPILSQQLPVSAPSPSCASLSSLSSLAENVNHGRSSCLDTDSDTLSVHSPAVSAPLISTDTPPPSGNAPLPIHHKFHRKAWLHHYLNEGKKETSDCSFTINSKLVQNDNKADGAVRGCYISLSYMSKDAQSQSPVKVTKDLNVSKNVDSEYLYSEGIGSSDGHNCKRTRNKKSGASKRVKSSDPESPPMPDLVQEKQLEVAENISDQSQEEDDNIDTQSSSSSNIPPSENPNELDSLSSQTDCETKMAARLKESKEKGKPKGNPSSILESKPLNSLSDVKRKKSKEAFLQDGACSDITPKLVKCRECKMSRTQRNKNLPNIFCRFYAFRKLRYSAKGFITVAGFSKPTDADADDIQLWMPICSKSNSPLTVAQAKYILSNIKDSCLVLFDLENEAASMASFQAKVAWKRPIQGVREMCDVCDATLFDIHWACNKCGFAVCADCYRSHSQDKVNSAADENKWLTCSANRHEHEPETLMITQIIPSDVRMVVGRMLREVSAKWKIQSVVRGEQQLAEVHSLTTKNGISEPNHMSSKSFHNGVKLEDRSKKGRTSSRKKHTLRSLAPFLSTGLSEKIESSDGTRGADVASKVEESKSESSSENEMIAKNISARYKVSNICTNGECGSADACKDNTLEDSLHLWVDDGRLLQLLDSQNSDNIHLFQLGWQNAIPILISNCGKQLRPELWSPGSFAKEFGHVKVDLVDCSTGAILKSQPMDKFWNGFRHSSAPRSKQGATGASSILRLKDWPSVEDWAGPLASRNQDLNRLIPVSDYYHPAGVFNLISHLPEFFVRPDLTTRIHASYSSCAQHRIPFSKLRLDLADSINIMMYVETATTEDNQNATRALKEAGYNARAKSAYKTTSRVGAVWHIFRPQDADRIREFLKKVDASNSSHRAADHSIDPLADNSSYLDKSLRARLLNECGIQSTVVVQCLGDALFLPAMTPYQAKVIHSCIMVSKEFLSPESVWSCFARMQQAQKHGSPDCVNNIDDQLQIKNIIYHSVKDAVAVLQENNP